MTPANLIIFVLDTARRDRFGCYGYPRGTTPAVDTFAHEALVYDRMIAPAPWTIPSHASLFTGLYPREHRADNPAPILNGHAPTLAGHLREQGFTTVCVTNNPLLDHDTGLASGFAQVIVRPGRGKFSRNAAILGFRDSGAGATFRVVVELLRTLPRPFFLFVNYLECHWHYMPPWRFERKFAATRSRFGSIRRRVRERNLVMWEAIAAAGPGDLRRYQDLYDAELACVDEQVGQLLDYLRRRRLLDDTAIIVTADHGENIGEDGLASHQGSLRQNLIHVPFIARIPGRSGQRVDGLVQFTDVFSGLCGVLGVGVPAHLEARPFAVDPFTLSHGDRGRTFAFAEWQHWGRNKLDRIQRKAPHFDFSALPRGLEAVQDMRFKLVVDLGTGQEYVYDLLRDSGETRDVAPVMPAAQAALRQAREEWHKATERTAYTEEAAADQALVETRLRELGYL